jgi:hypothetical protein
MWIPFTAKMVVLAGMEGSGSGVVNFSPISSFVLSNSQICAYWGKEGKKKLRKKKHSWDSILWFLRIVYCIPSMDGTLAAGGSEEAPRSRGQLVAAAIASLQLLPCCNSALLLLPLVAPLGHAAARKQLLQRSESNCSHLRARGVDWSNRLAAQ